MANGRRHGNRDTQFEPERREARAIDLDPSAGGLHQGAQPQCCRSDAVHMAATDQMPDPKKALAPREPSTHGSSTAGDGATWLIVELCTALEARARHEEPPADHPDLVLDLATRHCPWINGGQRLVPSRTRACRAVHCSPLVQEQWTAVRQDSARTSAGMSQWNANGPRDIGECDCRRDPCRRRSCPPPSCPAWASDHGGLMPNCHRHPGHRRRRRTRRPCHARRTPSLASRADTPERTASGCGRAGHGRP